jgi:hypothetical protein
VAWQRKANEPLGDALAALLLFAKASWRSTPAATAYRLAISEGPQMSDDVNKAAIQYLKASGASTISVVAIHGVCSFHAGHKIDPNAVSVFWLYTETVAAAVIKTARQLAGKAADADTEEAALYRSAADNRTTLTPNATAMARAAIAAKKLDDFLGSMRETGVLMQFNKEYKRRRTEAAANGTGFMIYKDALGRLRLALVPLLMNNGQPSVGASLFEQVFR